MTQFEMERVLTGMRGRAYRYRNETHQVLRFTIGHVVKITTDRKDITILLDDFDEVIKGFHEVEETGVALAGGTGLQHQTVISSSGMELKNILMDNIRELKRSKEYVPRAQAVNETVKTIIDLARVEVDMIRVMQAGKR